MSVSFSWNNAALDIARAAAERGLWAAAQSTLTEAKKVAPLEEGTLARSGATTPPASEVVIYFDTVYAARQHEELGWQHAAGKQAKYLEAPFQRNEKQMLRMVADEVRKALE